MSDMSACWICGIRRGDGGQAGLVGQARHLEAKKLVCTMATPREGRRRAGESTGSSGVSGAWMIKLRPTPAYAEDRGKIERPRRRIAVVLLGRRDRGTAEGRNLVFSGVRGYYTHRARRWTAEEGRHGHLAKVRVRVDLFHRSRLRHVASHLALRAPSTGRTSNHHIWLVLTCSNCGISNIYMGVWAIRLAITVNDNGIIMRRDPSNQSSGIKFEHFESDRPVGEKRSLNPISKRRSVRTTVTRAANFRIRFEQVSRHTLGLKIRPARQSYGNGWHRCHKNGSKNVPWNFKVASPGCQPHQPHRGVGAIGVSVGRRIVDR